MMRLIPWFMAFAFLCTGCTSERFDRFGDALPDGAVARLGTTRLRCDRFMQWVEFTADGHSLVTGGANDEIHKWNLETGAAEPIDQNMPHPLNTQAPGSLRQERQSPDGSLDCAWDGKSRELVISRLSDGVEIFRIDGKPFGVDTWCFSPDGQLLAVRDAKTPGDIVFYSTVDGSRVRRLIGHKPTVQALRFSPDGSLLASFASQVERAVLLWDVATGTMVRKIALTPAGDTGVRWLAFSPDGATLAAAPSSGPAAFLWNIKSGESADPPSIADEPHRSRIFAAYFNDVGDDAGDTITTSDTIGQLRIWRWQDGQLLNKNSTRYPPLRDSLHRQWSHATPGARAPSYSVTSASGRFLLVNDNRLHAFDIENNTPIGKPFNYKNATGQSLSIANDGRLAALTTNATIVVWKTETGEIIREITEDDPYHQKDLRFLHRRDDRPSATAFAPDSSILAVGRQNGAVTLIHLTSSLASITRQGDSGSITAISFSKDGRHLVTGATNGSALVWDLDRLLNR